MTIERENIETKEVKKRPNLDAVQIYKDWGLVKNETEMLRETTEVNPLASNFLWQDLGESRLLFSDFSSWLNNHSNLVSAPRTGHIGGTWEAIIAGGGGNVAFNRGVLELGLGYPLLFDINMTPDEKSSKGDVLYYPGTILDGSSSVIEMEKYVFRDGKFRPSDVKNLYTPFISTTINGSVVAINQVHRARLEYLPNKKYVSDVLWNNWSRVESYLRIIIDRALLEDTASGRTSVVQKAIDKWISADGIVSDAYFQVNQNGINRNGKSYKWDEFINLVKLNVYISSHPEAMPDAITGVNDGVPQISKEFLILTMALLDTDFTQGTKCQGNINPHFHWGGFQMAGLGKDRGYFHKSVATIRNLMRMITVGSTERPQPIAYTLLPAGIFLLLPHLSNRGEITAINELLMSISNEPEGKINKDKTLNHVRKSVDEWMSNGQHQKLSTEFISRFSKNSHPMMNIPRDATLTVPETFNGLSLQQLLITAGFLKQALGEYQI